MGLHVHRDSVPGDQPNAEDQGRLQYRALLARIRDTVLRVVPANATVMAISRGDARLLEIDGRLVSHFPQNELGQYAGFHPADSTAAITHLESLRAKGAEFLLIPETAFWWLQHYKHFRRHLESRYAMVAHEADTCMIFALGAQMDPDASSSADHQVRAYRALVIQVQEVVDALLPAAAVVVVLSGGDEALVALGDRRGWHFPRDNRGVYAGSYPADSAGAIEHCEELRALGAEYVVIPRTAFWWLTHYREFAEYLTATCRLVTLQAHVCVIYALGAPPTR